MKANELILSILACHLALFAHQSRVAQAFWLTDGSLFSPPPTGSSSSSALSLSSSLNKQQQQDLTSAQVRPINGQNYTQNGDTLSVTSKVDPWVRLADPSGASLASPSLVADSQQTPRQDKPPHGQVAVDVCQCNTEWLQGQTSVWLNKWMSSQNFVQRLQHSISKSLSNATGQPIRSVAWSRPSKRHSGGSGGGGGNGANNGQHQPRSAPAVAVLAGQTLPATTASDQSVKVVRGEPGPKGDRGLAGERGPSGLITVRDRDALFDLPPTPAPPLESSSSSSSSSSSQSLGDKQAIGPPRRLAFVESEQLLAVETPLGWRPVQMLAPLRDFRKTIAKFSLSALDEPRLRLLSKGASTGGLQSPLTTSDATMPAVGGKQLRGASLKTAGMTNSILALDDNRARELDAAAAAAADEDDEDEDEDDEEDEEEDKFEDDVDETDEDEADADDEDQDEDEEDRESNSIKQRAHHGPAHRFQIKQSTADPAAKWKRRGQVSGRSAMAPPPPPPALRPASSSSSSLPVVVASEEPTKSSTDQRADLAAPSEPDTMKLRLVALNEPFAGNQHGLRGANFECKRHAARANIKGAFRALLATNYQNLNEIVRYAAHVQKYPVVNLRGEPIASSWHDLFRAPSRLTNLLSRIYSFDGRHVASDPNWPNKLVWLGTGSKLGGRDTTNNNCDGWHSDSLSRFGFATPLHSPKAHHNHAHTSANGKSGKRQQHRRHSNEVSQQSAWNATTLVFDIVEKYPCRMPLIVLCIETIAQNGGL